MEVGGFTQPRFEHAVSQSQTQSSHEEFSLVLEIDVYIALVAECMAGLSSPGSADDPRPHKMCKVPAVNHTSTTQVNPGMVITPAPSFCGRGQRALPLPKFARPKRVQTIALQFFVFSSRAIAQL